MAEKIKLEIVAPSSIVVSEEVDAVAAVGALGEFGVLPGHCQMLTSLNIGEVSFRKDGSVTYLSIGGGYAEVGPDKVSILAETAELSQDIDVERANHALNKAQEALKGLAPDDKHRSEIERAIERATVRLETAKKR